MQDYIIQTRTSDVIPILIQMTLLLILANQEIGLVEDIVTGLIIAITSIVESSVILLHNIIAIIMERCVLSSQSATT